MFELACSDKSHIFQFCDKSILHGLPLSIFFKFALTSLCSLFLVSFVHDSLVYRPKRYV